MLLQDPRGLSESWRPGLELVKRQTASGCSHRSLSQILKDKDNGDRFYSRSLEADAWSTAKTLLGWRDELKISGWNGEAPPKASERLGTLAELEKIFAYESVEGMGDRLQSILSRLEEKPGLYIKKIQLIEPVSSWASGWKRLLELLNKCGIEITDVANSVERGPGDLGRLQGSLKTGKPINDNVVGDGSLCLVRSQGEWEACEVIASLLETLSGSSGRTLIINSGGSNMLDDTLNRHNLPRLGYDSRSRWRAALQLLPLALGNYWNPLDPQKLLEFLIMPKSPVSRDIGVFLEKALREHPGLGGPKWNEAIELALKQYESHSFDADIEPEIGDNLDDYRKELSFWLGENERFDPDDGIAASVVIEICSRLNRWAARHGGQEKDDTLIAAAKLFTDVSQTIRDSGLSKITQPQLNRILDSVIGEGLEKPNYGAEAAPWSWVDTPGQIWGTADTIIWWNFCSEGVTPLHSPWTSDERNCLKSLKVELRETRDIRIQQSRSWRNAVTYAGQRLALVAPMSIAGEPLNYHPFWDEIHHALKLDERSIKKLTFDGARMWREEKPHIFGSDLIRESLACVAAPKPGQIWDFQANRIKGRIEESYSSVKMLIDCPLSWVCQYILELHPGTLALLPDRGEMLGTLSHAVMEQTLSVKPIPDPQTAQELALRHFDELVPQMAASLLFPERKSELERIRGLMGTAAKILVEHINLSGLKVRSQEGSVRRELDEKQNINGRVDLALGDDSSDKVVIDLKWSKRARYKREELEKGEAFQLAVYAWLLQNQEKKFPAGAYYMLAQGELVASSCDFFSPECVFHDVELESIWNRGIESYRFRIDELKNGTALAAGLSAEDGAATKKEKPEGKDPSPPSFDSAPKCDWCPYSNLCGMGVK